jgi:hypothetical protein
MLILFACFMNNNILIFFLYMPFFLNCSYTLYFFCNSKSNKCRQDTPYCPSHTISQQPPCHLSVGHSQQRLVFQHGSFHFSFVPLIFLQYALFTPGTYHSPSQYLYTNTTYSHSDHRPHHTISQFYTVFNQNICLCLF